MPMYWLFARDATAEHLALVTVGLKKNREADRDVDIGLTPAAHTFTSVHSILYFLKLMLQCTISLYLVSFDFPLDVASGGIGLVCPKDGSFGCIVPSSLTILY